MPFLSCHERYQILCTMSSSSQTSTGNDPDQVSNGTNIHQGNNDVPESVSSPKGIFERDDGKLAFVHHKKVVVISNFTTRVNSMFEASNVAGYIFEVESVDRKWQCALTLGQLCDSRVVLGILQNHCQDALWYRVPRDAPSYVDLGAYMFQQTDEYRMADTRNYRRVATIYPAWQACGIFVVDKKLQIDPKTRTCLPIDQRYVLYESSWKKSRGRGTSDDVTITHIKQPFSSDGMKELLVAFKGLLTSNYAAACLALGGTVMSLGYQRIIQAGGSCPVVLLTGDTETSKTTVLKACISLTGNCEARDYTAKKALERSKNCDVPFAWDDPTSKEDVKFIVQALFNQAGKDTVHSSGYPRSPPVISANFACANDKRIFSRQAIILFERPNPQLPSQIMATKKAALDLAAKQASTGFMEALCLVEKFLSLSSLDERISISNRIEKMFPGRIRSPDVYSKVMWFTLEVMKLAGIEDDTALVWDYLQSKIVPFIEDLFCGVQDSSSTLMNPPKTQIVWETLANFSQPLSKKQVATAFKTTYVNGKDCLAIAYDIAATFLKDSVDGRFLMAELKKEREATKGRLNFLSPDSPTDSFRVSKGKDVYGKSVSRQCVSVPLDCVPKEFLSAIQVGNDVHSSMTWTTDDAVGIINHDESSASDQEMIEFAKAVETNGGVDRRGVVQEVISLENPCVDGKTSAGVCQEVTSDADEENPAKEVKSSPGDIHEVTSDADEENPPIDVKSNAADIHEDTSDADEENPPIDVKTNAGVFHEDTSDAAKVKQQKSKRKNILDRLKDSLSIEEQLPPKRLCKPSRSHKR